MSIYRMLMFNDGIKTQRCVFFIEFSPPFRKMFCHLFKVRKASYTPQN